jgi:MoxR-like ATPase
VEARPLEQADAASRAGEVARAVVENVARVIHAPRRTLELGVLALLAEGHVILEDVPGVGKTMLARALARSVDCGFTRLQFTPDLLPSDVTGVSVFDQRTNGFEFRPGPVFTNLLLIDEVNRASPRTQAALLECMQESQVSVDGVSYPLARPFMVLATQNPLEHEGTYPLPEAQLDRFAMRLRLGYPAPDEEARMLAEQATDAPPLDDLEPVASAAEVVDAIVAAARIHVDPALPRYVVALLAATRGDGRLALGGSPRAGIVLLRVAKAHALLAGRTFVVPDDVKAVAEPVLAHRLRLAPGLADGAGADEVVADALERTPLPA